MLRQLVTYGSEAWCLTANDGKKFAYLGQEVAEKNIWSNICSRILEEQNKWRSEAIIWRTGHTYLLTPWCRVLLEKLTGLQLVKKFPVFHGTRRFITVLTSVRHLSLSWANPIQSTFPHPTSWRSILILSTHLRLGLPSGLLPSGFPTKTLYTPLSSPIRATCTAHLTKKYEDV